MLFSLICFQTCSPGFPIAMTTLVQTSPVQMESLIHNRENLQPTYSRHDVRQHCDDTSCWIIVDDKVYDVTKFLAEVSVAFNQQTFSLLGFLSLKALSAIGTFISSFARVTFVCGPIQCVTSAVREQLLPIVCSSSSSFRVSWT